MSFTTEIYDVITGDSSLNGLVDGGIHYENLIDNWVADTNYNEWVVYESRKSAQQDCMTSKNVFMTYQLSVVVIQRSTNTKLDVITNRLIDYLNNHESGYIQDIKFVSDDGGFDQQRNTYNNVLDFECVYLET